MVSAGRVSVREDVICAWYRQAHALQTSDVADVEFYIVCNVRELRLHNLSSCPFFTLRRSQLKSLRKSRLAFSISLFALLDG